MGEIMRGSSMKDLLEEKIKILSQEAWKDRVNGGDVCEWLNNFKPEECLYASFLLSSFIYFDNNSIRELLRRAYIDLYKRPELFKIRRKNRDTLDIGIINSKFNKILSRTRFINIGNPSESSAHLLYYYRQENDLPVGLFINAHEIYTHKILANNIKTQLDVSKIDTIIFIEDFCGSGTQATEYYEKFVKPIKKKYKKIRILFHSLFATQTGFNIVNDLGYDEVKTLFLLDESFKCFSNESRIFNETHNETKNQCQIICTTHGENLCKEHPLGYKDGQLLIGFYHNTPNNTLPIFWSTAPSWTPIFKRYRKRK